MAKSVYLSEGRFEDDDLRRQYSHELEEVSKLIRSGQTIEFDELELDRLLDQKALMNSFSRWHLVVYLIRVFFPAIAILLFLLAACVVLAWIKNR
jgi:hypothetical protein